MHLSTKTIFFIGFWAGGLVCGAGCSLVWAVILLSVITWQLAKWSTKRSDVITVQEVQQILKLLEQFNEMLDTEPGFEDA